MNTVISKRPTSFVYTKWADNKDGTLAVEFSITIDGGANVINPKSLVTPLGVATFVDDRTLENLMSIDKFRRDIERGLIRVEKGEKVSDPEKVDSIADSGKMAKNEDIPSRPLTSEDLERDGAVLNEDGSVDISKGGRNAVTRRSKDAGKPFYEKGRTRGKKTARHSK